MEGQDVGLRFGYPCIRWFTKATFENKEYFDGGGNLTDIGVAKLLHSAYRNECEAKEVKQDIPYTKFYDWVEERIDVGGKLSDELTIVIQIFNESTPVKKQEEKEQKKNQEQQSQLSPTSTELKEYSSESLESSHGSSQE